MQYLIPVGCGPSGKTCPRCASHFEHTTSVLIIPWERSSFSETFSGATGSRKLGHPVPESNFAEKRKSSCPQQTHTYIPFSWWAWYFPVKALSVPFFLVTRNCSSVSCSLHCSSVFLVLSDIGPSFAGGGELRLPTPVKYLAETLFVT